jgi:hypothetical protein
MSPATKGIGNDLSSPLKSLCPISQNSTGTKESGSVWVLSDAVWKGGREGYLVEDLIPRHSVEAIHRR